jgi:hypothetical protein
VAAAFTSGKCRVFLNAPRIQSGSVVVSAPARKIRYGSGVASYVPLESGGWLVS